MSTREMKRWAVMRRVRDRELSLGDAASILAVSYRQVRRIYQRFRARGHKGLVHGHVGRRSNHAHPPALRVRAVALITSHFSGMPRSTAAGHPMPGDTPPFCRPSRWCRS